MDFWGIKGNKSVCICAMQQKEGSMNTTDRTLEKKLFIGEKDKYWYYISAKLSKYYYFCNTEEKENATDTV